jgi:hypothetical protein
VKAAGWEGIARSPPFFMPNPLADVAEKSYTMTEDEGRSPPRSRVSPMTVAILFRAERAASQA